MTTSNIHFILSSSLLGSLSWLLFHPPNPSCCTLMSAYVKLQRIMVHPRSAGDIFLSQRAVSHPRCSQMPSLTPWRRLNGMDQLCLEESLDPVTVHGWARCRQHQIVQNAVSEENSQRLFPMVREVASDWRKQPCQPDVRRPRWLPQSSVKMFRTSTTSAQITGVGHLPWIVVWVWYTFALVKYQPRRFSSPIKGF